MRLLLCLALTLQSPVPLAVRVSVRTPVPAGTLASAEETASHMLGRAGLVVTWSAAPDPDAIQVQIVNTNPGRLGADANGYTILPRGGSRDGRFAAIFYPAIQKSARQLEAEEALVLGAVLAHEIGHILLGTKTHSRTGVMSPRFDREHVKLAANGQLLFTPAESALLRSAASQ